jgi:hypothetical protein
MQGVEFQHASLQNVYGRIVRHGGFAFSPADVSLNGRSFSISMYLIEFAPRPPPPVLRLALPNSFDAAWVYARLPLIFGLEPSPSEGEKSLLWQGFVAIPEGERVGYAFVCNDYYGRTGLVFSDEGPEEPIRRAIAAAFWDVMLQSPDEVQDFEQRVYHPGAGVWLMFGCSAGEPFCSESDE